MKKWKEDRNYKRLKDEKGNVTANIITVDGVDVEVTEEVFLAYSQADRRERYQDEQQEEHPQVSLELLAAHDVPIDLYMQRHEISAEDSAIQREEYTEFIVHKERLDTALNSLSIEDQALIRALFFDGLSTRAYAKQLGVYQRAVIYRRDKILDKLKKKIYDFFYSPHCFFGIGVRGKYLTFRCPLKTEYQQYGEPPEQTSVQ